MERASERGRLTHGGQRLCISHTCPIRSSAPPYGTIPICTLLHCPPLLLPPMSSAAKDDVLAGDSCDIALPYLLLGSLSLSLCAVAARPKGRCVSDCVCVCVRVCVLLAGATGGPNVTRIRPSTYIPYIRVAGLVVPEARGATKNLTRADRQTDRQTDRARQALGPFRCAGSWEFLSSSRCSDPVVTASLIRQ
ncbi:hypothetical protein F4780DRAFT_452088 [Xylariomycetidae sp. FL0641]|nr:hypothetical protein F4780DRAFT_452088 [Xylariomycetidae sp. FL0641]